mmetsp:Transcript_8114/g.9803  ORF Transcript_8114/g.9803 Transcript_8114/m.9803 type:complete len:266 (+) Transcript_8114:88-885(+)
MAQQAGLFERIANEVIETAERAAQVLDEGLSIVMSGGADDAGSSSTTDAKVPSGTPPPQDFHMGEDIMDGMDMDEMAQMMGESSPLQGIAEGVIGDIMANSASQPETAWEHVQAFTSAITWKEPFVLSLLIFQIVIFGLSIWASNPQRGLVPRFTMMLLIGALVRSAEYINTYASQHWEEWGITQNYFDRHGIFVGIMFCGPLLLNCFIMLLRFLREASQLLIEVKKVEIQKQRKQQQKNKKNAAEQTQSGAQNNKKKKRSKKDD